MIKVNDSVKIHFTCVVNGDMIDSTYDREPLTVTIGDGRLLNGVEDEILNLKIGDKKSITISKEDAFGDIQKELFQEVDLKTFNLNGAKIGDIIDGKTSDNIQFECRVVDINEKKVFLDFNHPYAGKDLIFNVEIISIN